MMNVRFYGTSRTITGQITHGFGAPPTNVYDVTLPKLQTVSTQWMSTQASNITVAQHLLEFAIRVLL